MDGQAGPGSHAGPGGGDEAGAGRCWELPPDRRQPGSSAGETSISSNSLHMATVKLVATIKLLEAIPLIYLVINGTLLKSDFEQM